jgi:hypothetical protein
MANAHTQIAFLKQQGQVFEKIKYFFYFLVFSPKHSLKIQKWENEDVFIYRDT